MRVLSPKLRLASASAFVVLLVGGGVPGTSPRGLEASPAPAGAFAPRFCTEPPETEPPEYYAIRLIATEHAPGASGAVSTRFQSTPFGVAVAPDGSYVYDVVVAAKGLPPAGSGGYVAWVASPNLDRIEKLGALDGRLRTEGTVDMNKFLVIVTAEPSVDAPSWTGPIVLRGLSRSGRMASLAEHEILEFPC